MAYAGLIMDVPCNLVRIEDLQIMHRMNEHSSIRIRAVIHEKGVDGAQELTTNDKVKVYIASEDGLEKETCLFAGIVLQATVEHVQGIFYVDMVAVSHTYKLDTEWRKRSYQNQQKTYAEVIRKVLEPYAGASLTNAMPDTTTGQMLLQYQETDWEFILRLASRLGTVIVPIVDDAPAIALGIPQEMAKNELAFESYTMQTRYVPQRETQEIRYQIQSRRVYRLGNQMEIQRRPFVIYEMESRVVHGELLHSYTLLSKSEAKLTKILPYGIQGLSLEGKITKISRNKVQLHLDIDKEAEPDNACWFPFSTGMDNQSAYMMPKPGSPVKLHFPKPSEKSAIATSSVRRGAEQSKYSQKSANPAIKSLTNDSDQEMKLTGEDIVFAADAAETVKLQLAGDGSIKILANTDISIAALEDFLIDVKGDMPAPKMIEMTAGEMVAISRSPMEGINPDHYIYIADLTDVQAATIYYEGTPGKPPADPFDDSELLAQDAAAMAEINGNALLYRQALVSKMEAGKSKIGFGKIAMLIGAAAVGVAAVVLTGGAAAPLVIAAGTTLVAGATTMVVAGSEMYEGSEDIAKARKGDLSESYNFMRDTVLQGNAELYDTVKYGSVIVSVGGISVLTGGGASALILPSIGGGVNVAITAIFDPVVQPGETLIGHYLKSFQNGFLSGAMMGKFMSGIKCGTGFSNFANIYGRSVAGGTISGMTQDMMNTGSTSLTSNLAANVVGGLFAFTGKNRLTDYASSVAGGMGGAMAEDLWRNGNVNQSLTWDTLKKVAVASLATMVKTGDPVDVTRGGFHYFAKDMILLDIGSPIEMVRNYNSLYPVRGLTGRGFIFTYESYLKREGNRIYIICPDSHYERFTLREGHWVNEIGGKQDYRLIEREDSAGYVLIGPDRTTCEYDDTGRLRSIADPSGNRTQLDYNDNGICRLTAPGGKSVSMECRDGLLMRMTDNIGRTVVYEYDGDLLVRVTYPNQGMIHYTYTEQGYLQSITDQNGNTYVTNTYDARGRVVQQRDAYGQITDIEYNDVGKETIFMFRANDIVEKYRYNDDDLVTEIVYQDGTWESFEYDAYQFKCAHTDTGGRTTRWEYGIHGQLLTEIAADGTRHSHVYDEHLNRISVSVNHVVEKTYAYDRFGRVLEESAAIDAERQAITAYTYDAQGRVLTRRDALGYVTTYAYEVFHSNSPSYVKDAEGQEYRYAFDDAARVTSITTAYGSVEFEYNDLNKRTRIVDAEGNTTLMFYDKMGNMIKRVQPNDYVERIDNGKGTEYRYDALDHLIRITDPLHQTQRYHYDMYDHLLKEVEPNQYDPVLDDGPGTEHVYDHRGNRIRTMFPDGGIQRFKYDAAGNLVKSIRPGQYDPATDDGPGTEYAYDAMDRLVQITNAEGYIERRYVYDSAGRIVKEMDGKAVDRANHDDERFGTLYVYNKAGWLVEKREPVQEEVSSERERVLYRLSRYEYDLAGNLVREQRTSELVAREGSPATYHGITYAYDRNHRVIRITDDTGADIRYTYDCLNQRTSERYKLNEGKERHIRYEYDKAGRLVRQLDVIDGEDLRDEGRKTVTAETRYRYDRNGNITYIRSPEGYETEISYDGADRIVQISRREHAGAKASSMYLKYDRSGNVIEETDTMGHRVHYAYDVRNRPIRSVGKRGGVTRLFYNTEGKLAKKVTPGLYDAASDDGIGTEYTYDVLNRLTHIRNPLGEIIQQHAFNRYGEQEAVTENGVETRYTYTLAGQVRQVWGNGPECTPMLRQEYEYDAAGHIVGIRDGEGRVTRHTLDGWGNITALTRPDATTEQYDYDVAGHLIRSTDAKGHATQYTYNSLGQVSAITGPDGLPITYQYDREGRLARQQDRNQRVLDLAYNFNDQLVRRRELSSGEEETYTYREDGLLTSSANNEVRYDYDYNEEGLLTAKYQSRFGERTTDAAPRPVLRYEYDVEGRTVARTDAGGTRVEYAHDPLGRVVAIRQGENELARYTYAAGNRIASMLYGNGVQTAYEYTPEGQVSRLYTRAADGTVLLDNRYTYDRSGNTIGCYGTQDQAEYRYDALDRLVEARYAGYGTEQLAYDAAGNRISRVWNGQRTSYTYDTRNRLLSLIEEALQEESGEQSKSNGQASGKHIHYTYDAQGNLIQEHQGEQTTSYAYDAFNRTIRVEQADGRIVQHGYDPEGLRSRLDTDGTVRHFVHDSWHVVNELDETERVQASYIRGHEWLTQLDDQGDVAYYVNNIHGDVTHLTGSQGQILNAYTYDAFGNMLSSREQRVNPFRYAGEMQDALTGHYYLRARFYNPIIARFTQEDTYRGDGLNLYAYVANNPIRYVDPSGYAKAASGGTPASCVNKGETWNPNNTGDFTEITITYKQGMPKYQFKRKAEALQQLGELGVLVKAANPVKRDRSVTKAYRQDLIQRIWSQYGQTNKDFANKLIDQITDHRKMQPDHVWELQLSGPDVPSNLKFLDSFTNEDIGMRQIWPQIKGLPVGTKIKIKIEY
ncbi:RHS repeat-associated core domain-containing protein [Paenibacillus sp. FSL W8-0426]|uniref:RHS repeat-associated core domain-containing protein n=1 Tax=Paenibacillus sp. FSL W8-0426 TaxID=2921714 RepID=UPI0030D6E86B